MKKFIEWFVLIIVFSAPFVLWAGLRIYNNVVFEVNCEGHIKRASDANTIEIADKELQLAIDYLDKNKITEGFTSVIYQAPADDVGFLYQNLKSSVEELNKVKPEATQLERTNVLMKLRETLLDHGEHGDKVTLPDAIEVFPNNKVYFWTGWITGIWIVVGVIFGIMKANE